MQLFRCPRDTQRHARLHVVRRSLSLSHSPTRDRLCLAPDQVEDSDGKRLSWHTRVQLGWSGLLQKRERIGAGRGSAVLAAPCARRFRGHGREVASVRAVRVLRSQMLTDSMEMAMTSGEAVVALGAAARLPRTAMQSTGYGARAAVCAWGRRTSTYGLRGRSVSCYGRPDRRRAASRRKTATLRCGNAWDGHGARTAAARE